MKNPPPKARNKAAQKRAKVGPFGEEWVDRDGNRRRRLTAEGQARLVEWLEKYPEPGKLLNKAFRSTFNAAMVAGMDYEEVNALCMEAACVAMIQWFETICKFETYAAWWMRHVVGRRVTAENKPTAHGVVVQTAGGTPGGERSANEGRDFSLLAVLPTRGDGRHNHALAADIEAAVAAGCRTEREADIFFARIGPERDNQTGYRTLAARHRISRTRCQEIDARSRGRVRDAMIRKGYQ